MQGYVLFHSPSGTVDRVDAHAVSRAALRRTLEEQVPDTHVIVGMVLPDDDARKLRIVA